MYYINKFVILLCLLSVVNSSNDDLKVIDSIRNESPCLSQGGMCTIAADCPQGLLTEEKGLCPEQQGTGVECCYGQSVKETRCNKLGGSCISWCTEVVFEKHATDCEKDTMCCTLVKK